MKRIQERVKEESEGGIVRMRQLEGSCSSAALHL